MLVASWTCLTVFIVDDDYFSMDLPLLLLAILSAVKAETWLNVAQLSYNTTCSASSEARQHPCTHVIDEREDTEWRTRWLPRPGWIDIRLPYVYNITKLNFRQLVQSGSDYSRARNVTISFNNNKTLAFTLADTTQWQERTVPPGLGEQTTSLRVTIETIHNYYSLISGFSGIRVLARYIDVAALGSGTCDFPYSVGGKTYDWCTSSIDSSRRPLPSCKTVGGYLVRCSKPVLQEIFRTTPPACSTHGVGNRCSYGNDDIELTAWAVRNDNDDQDKCFSQEIGEVSVSQIEILDRLSSEVLRARIEISGGPAAPPYETAEWDPATLGSNHYKVWEPAGCFRGTDLSIFIERHNFEKAGFKEMKIRALAERDMQCHRCNSMSGTFVGPPNIDRRWCEMQDMCYHSVQKRCLHRCQVDHFGPGCSTRCYCQNAHSCNPATGPGYSCVCIQGYYKDTTTNSLQCEKGSAGAVIGGVVGGVVLLFIIVFIAVGLVCRTRHPLGPIVDENDARPPQHVQSADENEHQCNVCYNRTVNAVFLTCGHARTCLQCANQMMNEFQGRCPECRTRNSGIRQIFL